MFNYGFNIWGYPPILQIILLIGIFPYKPTIWGYPHDPGNPHFFKPSGGSGLRAAQLPRFDCPGPYVSWHGLTWKCRLYFEPHLLSLLFRRFLGNKWALFQTEQVLTCACLRLFVLDWKAYLHFISSKRDFLCECHRRDCECCWETIYLVEVSSMAGCNAAPMLRLLTLLNAGLSLENVTHIDSFLTTDI